MQKKCWLAKKVFYIILCSKHSKEQQGTKGSMVDRSVQAKIKILISLSGSSSQYWIQNFGFKTRIHLLQVSFVFRYFERYSTSEPLYSGWRLFTSVQVPVDFQSPNVTQLQFKMIFCFSILYDWNATLKLLERIASIVTWPVYCVFPILTYSFFDILIGSVDLIRTDLQLE